MVVVEEFKDKGGFGKCVSVASLEELRQKSAV